MGTRGRVTGWAGRVLAAVVVASTAACGGAATGDDDTAGSGTDTADEGGGGDSGTSTTDASTELVAGFYDPGDCVVWRQDENSDVLTDVVPCDEPHYTQVVELVDTPVTEDGAYPTEEQWIAHEDQVCLPAIERFLGVPLDPFGRFSVYTLMPTPDSWEYGDREMWCGIGLMSVEQPDGTLFAEDVREAEQAVRYAPGACVTAPTSASIPAVVSCTEPHVMEVVGELDLSHLPAAPTDADNDAIWAACDEQARGLLGGDPPTPWQVGYEDLPRESWEAGTRFTHCFVGQWGPGGEQLTVNIPVPR